MAISNISLIFTLRSQPKKRGGNNRRFGELTQDRENFPKKRGGNNRGENIRRGGVYAHNTHTLQRKFNMREREREEANKLALWNTMVSMAKIFDYSWGEKKSAFHSIFFAIQRE